MEATLFQRSPESMQTLLHSTEEEHDDLLPQPEPLLNRTYTSVHMSGTKFSTWNLNHPDPSGPEERDNTITMLRFMTDADSPRTFAEVTTTTGYVPTHSTHLSIATSWAGSHYEYPSPTASSIYESQFPPGGTASTGSLDEQQFAEVIYDDQSDYERSDSGSHSQGSSIDRMGYRFQFPPRGTASTGSPVEQQFAEVIYGNQSDYQRRDSGSHSQGSSIDGMGCISPSSPGINTFNHWRRCSDHSIDSNLDINDVPPPSHRHSQCSFVSLKSIQSGPAEDDNDERENLMRRHRNSIPDIYINGHEHSDHEHNSGRASPWDTPMEYYSEDPMNISCTSPTSKLSPSSPRAETILEGRRKRRRSRSGSTASQPSSKARSAMMQPHPDAIANSKSHKGRGAGKKTKERQICPEHPTKAFRHDSDFRKHMQTKHTRPFLCTFRFANCEQTFGSKNEWKRHVFSQHLQLYYWHCDDAKCADRKAYFNRKDLFGQHLKRMHGPKMNSSQKNSAEIKNWLGKEIPQIQDRCRKVRRAPPETSKCGYCEAEFSGEGSWDARMEHVGKHYEKNNYKQIDTKTWVMDMGLVRWALNAGIIERTPEGGYRLLCNGKGSIEGEERRICSQHKASALLGNEDSEMDAEGEPED